MSQSLWTESQKLPEFPTLRGDKNTDVLIIGGGLCGVLCAYFLKNAGVDYLLVEGDCIGGGITRNTTAKLTSQHGLIYDKLLLKMGREKALMYLQANEKALGKYRELAQSITCDFEEKDAYVYSLKNREKLEREAKAVNSLGLAARYVEEVSLPFATEGAVCFPEQAQFNPLKFLAGIVKDLNIYEHTFIQELMPGRARTAYGEIRAKKMIVTTHFPFINKHGSYFLKLYQHRSCVIALIKGPDVGGMYVDESRTGMSFRNYGDYLLVGGGGHRTGKKGGNWSELRKFVKATWPGAQEAAAWAAQDCMSLDGIPYIGQYSEKTPDMYVAAGFNKWGMTSSMAAGMLLTDLILEKENPWRELFSPSRSIWTPQLFINGGEALFNLLTPTFPRCPHLGCALKWNKAEHTWDCPCHGSRFEKDGALIDNPATGSKKF